jgi:putative ABC transport system permease protein
MQAWLQTRTGAVVGEDLAARFKWKIGDRVPLVSSIGRARAPTPGNSTSSDLHGTKPSADKTSFFFATTTSTKPRGGQGTVAGTW